MTLAPSVSKIMLSAMIAKYMRTQWWERDRVDAYQSKQLLRILRHATDSVPHYRNVTAQTSNQTAFDWLQRFPILTKADVQASTTALLSTHYVKQRLQSSRSSGTTGEPTRTYFDESSWVATRYALKARRILNTRFPLGERILVITESDEDQTVSKSPFARHLFGLHSVGIRQPIEDCLQALNQFRPTIIQGFPSFLDHLIDESQDRRWKFPECPVVFTSSELLTPKCRSKIENAFCAKVTDIYGTTEFKEIAVECERGRYHINFESVFVESLGNETAHGRLVVTTLLNNAMPLIRFDIGDCGRIGYGSCLCGRNGPYLHSLTGRSAELLRFTNGVVLSAFALTMQIERFEEIRSYTIAHKAPMNVVLEIFCNGRMTVERERELLFAVENVLPKGVTVNVDYLIERPQTGKRVAVRRDFDPTNS